ncbi:MAG: LamG-like jellyroll fold domain-containing protein [Sporichthyaceae bacterium]
MTDGQESLALAWPAVGDLPAPELTGSAARYSEVLPGVDVVAQAGVDGFTTFVILRDEQAASNPAVQTLKLAVEQTGLRVQETNGNALQATADGERVFTASQPLMWDSAEGSGASSDGVTPEEKAVEAPLVAPQEGNTEPVPVSATSDQIVLTPDPDLLQGDDSTVFPLVIDPSVTRARHSWLGIWDNGVELRNHATELARVGYDGWSGENKKTRAYFRMNLDDVLTGKIITEATFAHKLVHSPNHDCDLVNYGPGVQVYYTDPFTSTTTWTNRPTLRRGTPLSETSTAHGSDDRCPGWDRQEWEVTAAVKEGVAGGDQTATFMMKSAGEDAKNREGWRKYSQTDGYPVLTVTYYVYPPTPGAISISKMPNPLRNGRLTATDNPTLSASVEDPNGGSAYARFAIYDNGVEQWTKVSSGVSATGGTASVTVPDGVLDDGEDYTVRAWSSGDDLGTLLSANYSSTTFRVDISAPRKPTLKLLGPCVVGQDCSFSITTVDTDVWAYRYGMNTDEPVETKPNPAANTVTVTVPATTFGPGWFSVKAEDNAGNVGTRAVIRFRVESTFLSHQWRLDGNGYDEVAQESGSVSRMFLFGGLSWGPGASAVNVDDVPLDVLDRSLRASPPGGYACNTTSASTPCTAPLANFDTGQDFSVATWVQVPPTPTGLMTAVSQTGGTTTAFELGLFDGSWTFGIRTSQTAALQRASLPSTARPGQWVHLAAVFDNDSDDTDDAGKTSARTITLYVDGVASPAVSVTAAPYQATGAFMLGRATVANEAARLWLGGIDDVRTYPGVLDPSQVLRISTERRPY